MMVVLQDDDRDRSMYGRSDLTWDFLLTLWLIIVKIRYSLCKTLNFQLKTYILCQR